MTPGTEPCACRRGCSLPAHACSLGCGAGRATVACARVQEVRILKGVRHPNVLFFRGICLNPPMIITELCEHGSVSDVITLTVRMSQPNSTLMLSADKRAMLEEHMQWVGRVRLALDAAKGMLYLHSKDLLHCDLKSLNLLIDKAWTCKVADFGLSRCGAARPASRPSRHRTSVSTSPGPLSAAVLILPCISLGCSPGSSSQKGVLVAVGMCLKQHRSAPVLQHPWTSQRQHGLQRMLL